MKYSKLNFGKHKDKTLPQVVFSDPDWFLWAIENNVFDNKSIRLIREANDTHYKIRNIAIKDSLCVEHFIHPPTKKYSHFELVPESKPKHIGSSPTIRDNKLDISIVRKISKFDKKGGKNLIISMKKNGIANKRMDKNECEKFFNDDENFIKKDKKDKKDL